MTHASLFSGIGGFDLAAEWAGWTNAFNCEIDPFCRKVLKYHFPNAEQYEDIRTTDFTVWKDRIDVLTGGFPCQPFSLAGKRRGTEDYRYLWPAMLDVIRTVRPRWVVGDVGGITECADYIVGMDDIITDIDRDAPEDEFVKYYDYCLRVGSIACGKISTPNYSSWLSGCPRMSEEQITRLEELQRDIRKAERELEEQIRKEKF